jgi:hypothetical protein
MRPSPLRSSTSFRLSMWLSIGNRLRSSTSLARTSSVGIVPLLYGVSHLHAGEGGGVGERGGDAVNTAGLHHWLGARRVGGVRGERVAPAPSAPQPQVIAGG